MQNVLNLFSQYNLFINSKCQLSCSHCSVDKKVRNDDLTRLIYLIENNAFFKYYPKKKIYNIVSSEPFNCPDLLYVLTFLKSHGIEISLWFNGLSKFEYIRGALSIIDAFFIYFPAANSIEYMEITNKNKFDFLLENITLLKEHGKKIILNHPVKRHTINFLPEIYEFAYYNKLSLVIHYNLYENNLSEKFHRESIKYVKRYYKVPNVYVFRSSTKNQACSGVPIPGFDSYSQILNNIIRKISGKFMISI